MNEKRKIIQIVVDQETEENYEVLFALCNDGTLWERVGSDENDSIWTLLKNVPQGNVSPTGQFDLIEAGYF